MTPTCFVVYQKGYTCYQHFQVFGMHVLILHVQDEWAADRHTDLFPSNPGLLLPAYTGGIKLTVEIPHWR